MEFKDIFDALKSHFENTIIKHFAYDEQETSNEINERAYALPSIFIAYQNVAGIDDLFSTYSFKLKLEVKVLSRLNNTLSTIDEVKELINNFDTNGQRIGIKNVNTSHKAGNTAIHIFDCYINTRN